RRSRGQSIPRMFQEILFPSYKPHPLVGGAVDSKADGKTETPKAFKWEKCSNGEVIGCFPRIFDCLS
ncbi:MAG: hypothetical protein ACYTXC_06495, partial [Nostoc sp.]